MRILEAKNYEEMSALAAGVIGAQVLLQPRCVLGLATGSSPIGTYEKLVEAHRAGRLDFSQVRTVNLDEYCGLSGDNPQSYRYFMEKHLFSQVNLPQGSTQLLGIGHNGHIGFNEPCDSFPAAVHPVELTESTIQANSRLFDRVEDVPTRAITMGIGTILKARRILLIAGADKREIVEKALTGPITPWVPASVLQLHRDVTVITCGE